MSDLRDGIPCSHPGCLSHVSHPCEGCGRIGGRKIMTTKHSKGDEMKKENCESCRFYPGGTSIGGNCVRHAPVVIAIDKRRDTPETCYPQVDPSGWCGDYEPKVKQNDRA